jgi:hypothetical protein
MIPSLPENVENFLGSLDDAIIENPIIPSTCTLNDVRDVIKDLLFDKIQPYYLSHDIEATTGIYNLLVEPLKNAVFYGGENVKMNLFLSPIALVSGYADGGDYFNRLEVKQHWEDRKIFPEKRSVSQKGIGYGVGTSTVYDLANLIHVDINTGTLYVGASVDGILFVK